MSALARTLGLFVIVGSAFAQLQPPTLLPTVQIDAVSIRITQFGPYPATVTHGPLPFLLYISNRSGTLADTYSLFLKPLAGQVGLGTSLLDLHSVIGNNRDSQLIQLLPGNYELHVLSRPDWVVSITVTAN